MAMELNGVEIIRRLLRTLAPESISGTLLCVPVVNVFGFISRSRYLPGPARPQPVVPRIGGGLAGGAAGASLPHRDRQALAGRHRPAHGRHSPHQSATDPLRVPQAAARQRAGRAFGAEVLLESPERPGSLREAARAAGVDVLSYEGGEGAALRRVRDSRRRRRHYRRDAEDGDAGPRDGVDPPAERRSPVLINASSWLRSPEGGVFRTTKRIGDGVSVGEVVGYVAILTRTPRSRCARRGAASSSGARRCRSSTWAMRCSTSAGRRSCRDRASPEREILDEPIEDDEVLISLSELSDTSGKKLCARCCRAS
ncbi:MAG: succinylglutamate desuccinylase/aspartoacylase family protein [Hyphomicrobium sp.]